MKFHIQSFGCQMNVYDAGSLCGLLNAAGHEFTPNLEEAELILLNTCAIREGAEQRVRGRIGQLKKYKDQGTLRYLGVCGCMGQKEGERLTDSISFLDLVMGPGAIGSIARLVEALERGERPVIDLTGLDEDFDEFHPPADEAIHYPRFVSIMKGCDKKCSFCIVPYTRGGECSRAPHIILQEIETLAQRGYREITLIGQTVNSYRYGEVDFAALLAMVNHMPGIERIRFSTSHPNAATPDMLRAAAELDKVCEQLHLPVQSGSNRILERMERDYRREEYLERIAYYRRFFENSIIPPAVTTDVIVGFPGETEEDFLQTMELLKTVRCDAAFMFKYSPRRGTPAAEMKDQVSEDVKAERLERLIKLQHEISHQLNNAFIGKQVEVMVERIGADSQGAAVYEARLRTGRTLKLGESEEAYRIGDLIKVNVTDSSSYTLYGIPCERKAKSIVA
ncbi:MAG: tRNA (N6-isopentenyl adenosine(37)-C2)-methylthiotransferase MiaB [Candidatus Omnitrophota bacterium]